MNLTNFIYLAINSAADFCNDTAVQNVSYLIGIVMIGIKIAVPIVLIIVGMTDLLQAISSQGGKDDKLKEAQSGLVKKAVGAVAIFLVTTIVGLLMTLIGGTQYESCMDCVTRPFSQCKTDFGGNGK